jgi:CheY-like chemotaxis protein
MTVPDPPDRTRILLVEDVPLVAAMMVEILDLVGYTVDLVPNGREALERIDGIAYDLVITDLAMPELDGLGLYRALGRQHPGLQSRLIVVTGSQPDSEAELVLVAAGVPVLRKPFTVLDLQRTVDEFLTAHRPVARALS